MSGAAPLGRRADRAGRGAARLPGHPGLRHDRDEPGHPRDPARPALNRPGTIGPPLPSTECRLVDPESGEDVEPGERGELWIRGPQVMKGYLNNDGGDGGDDRRRGLAPHRRRRRRRRGRLLPDRRPAQGADQVQGLPGRRRPSSRRCSIGTPTVADVAVIGVPDEEAASCRRRSSSRRARISTPRRCMEWVAGQVSPQKRVRLVETIDEIPKSASGKILRRQLSGRDGDSG